jgi:hypothetical protein
MMIVVHPLDYPLFRALFEGELDIDRFFKKRNELAQRQERGEALGELIEEATTFASSFFPKKRGTEAKAEEKENALLAAANRGLANWRE